MQVQGHRPDVGILNTALEVLTRSGVLSAQLKAAQLFQGATRQGQLRCLASLSLCLVLVHQGSSEFLVHAVERQSCSNVGVKP